MKKILLYLLLFSAISCTEKPLPPAGALNLSGYKLSDIDGSEVQYGFQLGINGSMASEGMLTNGVQNGMWLTYFPDEENKVQSISNYVNGTMNGPYIEMNNRGQIEKRITYINNKIHGLYSEFKFGRPSKEFMYDNGTLDGISKEYNDRGKLIKQTSYKQGKLHGEIIQYDDDGAIILKYEYKNGEKVSGGIVSPE